MEVSEGKRGSTYPALKKLGLRPGKITNHGFLLTGLCRFWFGPFKLLDSSKFIAARVTGNFGLSVIGGGGATFLWC